jgi:DNA-binding protein H-NS
MAMLGMELESIPLDELWSLHEEISRVLSARIRAEKIELEKRLAVLRRGVAPAGGHLTSAPEGKTRRRYPRVLPKYRNPDAPSETWSGRGKRPRWLVAAMKLGRKIEEFRIADGSPNFAGRQRSISPCP